MDAHQVKAVLSRLSTFNAEIAILSLAVVAGVAFWLTLGTQSSRKAGSILSPYTQFAYNNFIKPHDVKAGEGQQHALESFYARQVGRTCLVFNGEQLPTQLHSGWYLRYDT